MDNKSYIFRGRKWSLQEIEMIKEIIRTSKNRTDISKKVCKRLRWKQADGRLKDAACREVLRRMESKGLINLPPPITYSAKSKFRYNRRFIRPREGWDDSFKIDTSLIEDSLGEVTLIIINNQINRNLWE